MMTARDLIDKYHITLTDDGEHIQLRARLTPAEQKQIINLKPEIISCILADKKAADDRQAKIDGIEGLKELREAILTNMYERDRFDAQFETEDGVIHGMNLIDVNSLREKYPRANAYLTAEDYVHSENYVKSGIGDKALERIVNGEDHEKVIADMEHEWNEYTREHIWD